MGDDPVRSGPPAPGGGAREVLALFARLGTTSFGGPTAHIAVMRDEVVRRRGWVTDAEFGELFGAASVLPGPTSTELALLIGIRRAGLAGLAAAAAGFIVPSVVLVLGLAMLYVRFGQMPAVGWVLAGVQPVVVAVVAVSIVPLLRANATGPLLVAIALVTGVLLPLGVDPALLLLGGGFAVVVGRGLLGQVARGASRSAGAVLAGLVDATSRHGVPGGTGLSGVAAAAVAPDALISLGVTFLKIGSVAFGSGYALLAFLRTDLVDAQHLLTERQLVDAVAAGQVTPGPLFTTATFIGYLLADVPGALVATAAIFVPGIVLVAVVHRFLPAIRRSAWATAFLGGASAAAMGVMAGVTVLLGRAVLVDPLSVALALGALALLLTRRIAAAWLIVAGAALGVAAHATGLVPG